MTGTETTPQHVLDYWFGQLTFDDWFKPSADLDVEIADRYRGLHLALAGGPGDEWSRDALCRLASILVFDQFPRNMYRGTPLAFCTDCLALALARDGVARGLDQQVPEAWRPFFYMPFEHSEDMADQDRSVALFEALGEPRYLDYARRHREVIARFGRFPHRNSILMRPSTDDEKVYLGTPGAGF